MQVVCYVQGVWHSQYISLSLPSSPKAGFYNSYQPPLALASKETFFTRQQKNVTCQINKDTNSYYTTPICIYSWIIINALRQKMLSWRMGICWCHIENVSDFYLINKTFTFKFFPSGNKFGFAGNIWACLSANITMLKVVSGIINEPQKLRLPDIVEFTHFSFRTWTFITILASYFRRCSSDMPASWSVDSTSLFLAKNFVWRFCFSLASAKFTWFKFLCLSQLYTLKDQIINVATKFFCKYQLTVWLSIQNFYSHFTKVTRKWECFGQIVEPCKDELCIWMVLLNLQTSSLKRVVPNSGVGADELDRIWFGFWNLCNFEVLKCVKCRCLVGPIILFFSVAALKGIFLRVQNKGVIYNRILYVWEINVAVHCYTNLIKMRCLLFSFFSLSLH